MKPPRRAPREDRIGYRMRLVLSIKQLAPCGFRQLIWMVMRVRHTKSLSACLEFIEHLLANNSLTDQTDCCKCRKALERSLKWRVLGGASWSIR